MSLYSWRLLLLSLAGFGLLLAVFSVLARMLEARIVRTANRMKARQAASLLFGFRLAPAAIAGFAIVIFCIPSYLLLEPDAPEERIGWLCSALAAFGLIAIAAPLGIGLRSLYSSAAFVRRCRKASVSWNGVWLVDSEAPVLACVGVFRPRVVLSRSIAEQLSADELEAAIRHEQAHVDSADNWKRLVLTCTPAAGSGRILEAWSRAVERAADDASAARSSNHRLDLAQALVRVARMRTAPAPRLATAFAADATDLESRVDRLLREPQPPARSTSLRPWLLGAGAALIAAIYVPALPFVHRGLELLVR